MFELLGNLVDATHAAAMLLWGLGLPLLFYQRWWQLSRIYGLYSLVFLTLSIGSHLLLDECVLTTVARALYEADGTGLTKRTSFIVRFVEGVAGLRPNERAAVAFWEATIFLGSIGTVLHLRRMRRMAPTDSTRRDDRSIRS